MTQSILTIGYASQLLQTMPDRIRMALDQLGIKPAASINGKLHYHEADIERVRQLLANTPSDLQTELERRAAGLR